MLFGFSGWQLFAKQGRLSLVDKYYKPTFNPVFDCKSSAYWSSTTNSDYIDQAWYVKFYKHRIHVYYTYKSGSCYARAVRGEQQIGYLVIKLFD